MGAASVLRLVSVVHLAAVQLLPSDVVHVLRHPLFDALRLAFLCS
jgi:hypothetical protein